MHFLRDMLRRALERAVGHCNRQTQPMIATAIRQVFQADSGDEAHERLAEVVERATGAGAEGRPAAARQCSRQAGRSIIPWAT